VAVHHARAEELPFDSGVFDASLAQLVVHFMSDPLVGLAEMSRVTREGGVVAVSVWDHAGDRGPVGLFWKAARDLDPDVHDESAMAGAREGHLGELLLEAGLGDVEATTVVAQTEHPTFDAWWAPFEEGVGPAGAYHAGLDRDRQAALREACRRLIPSTPFVTTSVAWACRGVVRRP
jgi:SAM-dependent methyltransferase